MNRTSQAIDFINAGRVDLAERLIREQLKQTPRDWDAHRVMAVCLRKRDHPKEALVEADQALALAPNSSLAHLERGRALVALKRHEEAEAELRTAIGLSPRLIASYSSLAGLLLARGDIEASMAASRSGLEIDPHSTDCLRLLGHALLRLHRVDEAHEMLRGALADQPTRALLHQDLGLSLLHRGDREAAALEFQEALRLNPQLVAAKHNLKLARRSGDARRPPYAFRFANSWPHIPAARRVSLIGCLAIAGFTWPGAWGAAALPVALEVRLLAARLTSRFAPQFSDGLATATYLVTLFGGIGVALIVLAGTPTTVAIPPQTSAIALPSGSLYDPQFQFTSDTVWDPGRITACWQFVTGIALFWVAIHPFQTAGLARRAGWVALGLAALAALAGAFPGGGPNLAVAGFMGAIAVSWITGRVVRAAENRGSRTEAARRGGAAVRRRGLSLWRERPGDD